MTSTFTKDTVTQGRVLMAVHHDDAIVAFVKVARGNTVDAALEDAFVATQHGIDRPDHVALTERAESRRSTMVGDTIEVRLDGFNPQFFVVAPCGFDPK